MPVRLSNGVFGKSGNQKSVGGSASMASRSVMTARSHQSLQAKMGRNHMNLEQWTTSAGVYGRLGGRARIAKLAPPACHRLSEQYVTFTAARHVQSLIKRSEFEQPIRRASMPARLEGTRIRARFRCSLKDEMYGPWASHFGATVELLLLPHQSVAFFQSLEGPTTKYS